jgi:predicted small secreted protein
MSCRPTQVMAALILAATALAGCTSTTSGSGTHTGSTAPVTSPASSAPATSGAATESAPVSTSPAAVTRTARSTTPTTASVPLCLSDIRVIPGTVDGAAGHQALVLIFNNVSHTRTCKIIGYPGVDLVNSSGTAVAHLRRTLRGMAGGEPAGVTAPRGVVLAPGASASALAEASNVPQGGVTDCGDYDLLITVPNQYVSVSGGTAKLPRCGAEIHPVVAGTRGGMA